MDNLLHNILIICCLVGAALGLLWVFIDNHPTRVKRKKPPIDASGSWGLYIVMFIGVAFLWHAYIKPSIMSIWSRQTSRRRAEPNGLPFASDIRKIALDVDARARSEVKKYIEPIQLAAEWGNLFVRRDCDYIHDAELRGAVGEILRRAGYQVAFEKSQYTGGYIVISWVTDPKPDPMFKSAE